MEKNKWMWNTRTISPKWVYLLSYTCLSEEFTRLLALMILKWSAKKSSMKKISHQPAINIILEKPSLIVLKPTLLSLRNFQAGETCFIWDFVIVSVKQLPLQLTTCQAQLNSCYHYKYSVTDYPLHTNWQVWWPKIDVKRSITVLQITGRIR